MIYFISDTHFYHEKIIDYCNRPFSSINEMHSTLINNWNSVVNNDDTIYHLGDVTFTNFNDSKKIIEQLNGNKILIKGNHDKHSNSWFIDTGFNEVYDFIKLDYLDWILLLTHKPCDNNLFQQFKSNKIINCHGHLHDTISLLNSKKYKCVSVERINYTPISINNLLNL